MFNTEELVKGIVERAIKDLFDDDILLTTERAATLSRLRVEQVLTDVACESVMKAFGEIEDFMLAYQLMPEHPDYPARFKS